MQIMFQTILCVLFKALLLIKAIITFIPKGCTPSNSLQEDSVPIYPDFNLAESNLSTPTSLRAFVQFDSQFREKINDIFVTLRWNQPELTDEIIQGYQVQCSFLEDFKETCDNKNITTTKLEHTVHNLTSNMTYYFRVRAHTKIVVGPYTNLLNVSTTHENTIPKLLLVTNLGIQIWDMDLRNITNFVKSRAVREVAYSIQEQRIYWTTPTTLMTLKINENNITKIASFNKNPPYFYIDWVTRNLYFAFEEAYYYIVKFDLTMWENGIIKFDKIFKTKLVIFNINVSPSMGILYFLLYLKNNVYNMMQYHLEKNHLGKNEKIFHTNLFFCISDNQYYLKYLHYIKCIMDNMNNEEPLNYWLQPDRVFVANINGSMCNMILHRKNMRDNILFQDMTIDKTNIYILAAELDYTSRYIYVLKKKYASLKSVNATEYVKKIKSFEYSFPHSIYAFDKSLQPYPPMRCLTPDENVYNFENVTVTTSNRIIVNLPEPTVKSGCKKYNLPTTIYTIFVSCLNNNLNTSEKFNVQTCERYYEIQNLMPFTEHKLKFTLSNFYFDQLSINLFDSNVISIKTNSGKLNAPENISVLGLTPTIAVVHWMPLKKVYCAAVTYEVHWESAALMNGTQQKVINMPKRIADGRFFTKINLSLPVNDYLIYVRVYPSNFSDFYNESLSEINQIYTEPNNITLSGANINSMNISWISNIQVMIFSTLEYNDVAAEEWLTMNYIKMNYNKEVTYHIGNLQSGTLYKFRLRLIYPEYEENFTWPADERFIFSTRGTKHGKQVKISIQHNKIGDILKNNFIKTLQHCKSIAKLC